MNTTTDFATMTDAERRALNHGRPIDMTGQLEGRASLFEYDDALQCTIEITPEGRQYIVRLVNGKMTRLRELATLGPIAAYA
jgi:hypothetical protein